MTPGPRERAALLAIGDLVDQMRRDLTMLDLALACVSCEVEDALRADDPGPLSADELIVLLRPMERREDDTFWGGR